MCVRGVCDVRCTLLLWCERFIIIFFFPFTPIAIHSTLEPVEFRTSSNLLLSSTLVIIIIIMRRSAVYISLSPRGLRARDRAGRHRCSWYAHAHGPPHAYTRRDIIAAFVPNGSASCIVCSPANNSMHSDRQYTPRGISGHNNTGTPCIYCCISTTRVAKRKKKTLSKHGRNNTRRRPLTR